MSNTHSKTDKEKEREIDRQTDIEEHRRELAFYTTIISFYLVVYYSTVSARQAGRHPQPHPQPPRCVPRSACLSLYISLSPSRCLCLFNNVFQVLLISCAFLFILLYLFSTLVTLATLATLAFLLTVPTATILGGPDLHVDKGSTINLTCTVKFSPEPPAYIFWYHHEEVIKLYCYISAAMPSLFSPTTADLFLLLFESQRKLLNYFQHEFNFCFCVAKKGKRKESNREIKLLA